MHCIPEAIELLFDHLALIGITPDASFHTDLRDVQDELGNPGPFTTWSHGDWTPANAFYDPSGGTETVRWGRSTNRQRVVAGLEHFGALAQASRDASAALRNIWPEPDCTFSLHKAFSRGA